jgi:hypothetical protein
VDVMFSGLASQTTLLPLFLPYFQSFTHNTSLATVLRN